MSSFTKPIRYSNGLILTKHQSRVLQETLPPQANPTHKAFLLYLAQKHHRAFTNFWFKTFVERCEVLIEIHAILQAFSEKIVA